LLVRTFVIMNNSYVGNLPPGITVPQLAEFMNAAMKQMNLTKDGQNSVVTAWVSPDGHFGFVELRSTDEATAALNCLNGIQVGMQALRVGRPKGYVGGAVPASNSAVPMQASMIIPFGGPGLGAANPLLQGMGGTGMQASVAMPMSSMGEGLSNVLMVSNIPQLLSETDIKELFTPFGEVSMISCTELRLN
jgi:hypothetical protein